MKIGANTAWWNSLAKLQFGDDDDVLNEDCFLFVCLFGGVSKAGEIRTLSDPSLPKTSLPVAVLRVAKGRIS
jgi:hypothetical protein